MNPVTVAILRRPNELVALISSQSKPVNAPRYGDSLEVNPFVEQIVPLAEAVGLNRDLLRELQCRWEHLGNVAELDDSVAEDIFQVLAMTIPDDVQSSVDPWRPPSLPKPPRATAAHPRAFRGTKMQPPSPQQASFVDLRPHLCNLRDQRAVLDYCKYKSLSTFTAQNDLLQRDIQRAQELFALPLRLRQLLWWTALVAKGNDSEWASIRSLYWALQLGENEPLRRAVARLLDRPWCKDSRVWLEAVRQLAPNRREGAVISLLEFVYSPSLQTENLSQWLRRIAELSDDESFLNRVWAFAQSLQHGVSIEALLSGFRLANCYQPDYDFVNKEFDEQDVTFAVTEWIEYVKTTKEETWNRESSAMHVWDDCGHLLGLGKLLERRNWAGLNPDDAYELYKVFRECRYAETPEAMESTLAVLLRLASRYFQTIRMLPEEYRAKGIRIFRTISAHWEGKRLERSLMHILDLLPVICAEPYEKSCDGRLYASMLSLGDDDLNAWLSGKAESKLELERASHNQNESSLIAVGLKRLAEDYPSWLVDSLEKSPLAMLKCAHTFGCLSKTQHFEAMETTFNHPIYRCHETELPLLATTIVDNLPSGVHDPIPRKVKAMLRGEVTLTFGQTSRAVVKIQSALVRTKIELARHAAVQVLAKALGIAANLAEQKTIEHAVKMQNMAMENRRALRKFLRAHLTGQEDYLNKHPANLLWLSKHSAIPFDRWQRGITLTCLGAGNTQDSSHVTLSVELNPLEALQLGSYVGSCLGIGGMLAASSAAVVLDVNKTVVYARNGRGKVVARQLLAISETDELVAFSVYPESVSDEIKRAFCEYDQMFANDLDIPLYYPDPDEETPRIARPISSYWWDDSAWNFR